MGSGCLAQLPFPTPSSIFLRPPPTRSHLGQQPLWLLQRHLSREMKMFSDPDHPPPWGWGRHLAKEKGIGLEVSPPGPVSSLSRVVST